MLKPAVAGVAVTVLVAFMVAALPDSSVDCLPGCYRIRRPVCGRNSHGQVRNFTNHCDLTHLNCQFKQDYVKIFDDLCSNIPASQKDHLLG